MVRLGRCRWSEGPFALPVLSGPRTWFAGDPSCRPGGERVSATRPLFGSPGGLWADPDAGEPLRRRQPAGLRPGRPAPPGDRRDPSEGRREDRHPTPPGDPAARRPAHPSTQRSIRCLSKHPAPGLRSWPTRPVRPGRGFAAFAAHGLGGECPRPSFRGAAAEDRHGRPRRPGDNFA